MACMSRLSGCTSARASESAWSWGDMQVLGGEKVIDVGVALAQDREGRHGMHAQAERQHLHRDICAAASLQRAQGLLLQAECNDWGITSCTALIGRVLPACTHMPASCNALAVQMPDDAGGTV